VNWLERPECALFIGDDAALAQSAGRAGGLRAGGDPLLDQRHLFTRELLVAFRHFTAVDQLEKQTTVGFARDEDRPRRRPGGSTGAGAGRGAFELLVIAPRLQCREDIRPILKAHSSNAHGEARSSKGGLDLRLRRLILQGGDDGRSSSLANPTVVCFQAGPQR